MKKTFLGVLLLLCCISGVLFSQQNEIPPGIDKVAGFDFEDTSPHIRINEIFFYTSTSYPGPEWVELYNDSACDVSLDGYLCCNSTEVIYQFPGSLPLVPPGGYVLILFDGQESPGSLDGNLLTLHSSEIDVFDEKADVCLLFSKEPLILENLASSITWGDISGKAKISPFTNKGLKKIWKNKKIKSFIEEEKYLGPNYTIKKGGSLGFKGDDTPVPFDPEDSTPGGPNFLAAPQLYLPGDGISATTDTMLLQWIPLDGGIYTLEVSMEDSFEEPFLAVENLEENSYLIESFPEKDTVYYWRVRVTLDEHTSAWSDVYSFTINSEKSIGILRETRADPVIGAPNPLGVPNRAARKDTELLCVDGCDAAHWDQSNEGGPQHAHSTWYCWVAAAQMLAMYRGGNVPQDEIMVYVKGDLATPLQSDPALPHGVDPEDSLPHAGHAGASVSECWEAVTYALQTVQANIHTSSSKPSQADIEDYIDNDRPIYYIAPGHAMVVDGYRDNGGVFEARFLNTDNNGTIQWRVYADQGFWSCAVPDTNLTGKIKDPRIDSDSDLDGVKDFDEDERFQTSTTHPDSEFDGQPDKIDIASYALRTKDPDIDGDGLRGEIDPDSDDGGLMDGLEDLDHDGEFDSADGETDPHNGLDDMGPDLDTILCIDTTGSMWDDIDAAKAAAIDIVDAIEANANTFRVAVVSFEDFPYLPYGNAAAGDYMYHDVLNFSDNKTDIVNAILSLQLRNGEDIPESHYSALMHCLVKENLGGWRDNVSKTVILMSDAPPHDPEPDTGYTGADVIQAAIDLDPAVIYPIHIGDNAEALAAYQELADGTGGIVFPAASAEEVVDAILNVIEVMTHNPVAEAGGPYFGEVGEPVVFNGANSYDNGSIVLYEWDFNSDGIYDSSNSSPVAEMIFYEVIDRKVTLRVTDNDNLQSTDTAGLFILDTTPPEVDIIAPVENETIKGTYTFKALANDLCGVKAVTFSVRDNNDSTGIPMGLEDYPATLNTVTGDWELEFDTGSLDSGYYTIIAKAVDENDNMGISDGVIFGINNWNLTFCLPWKYPYKAGRMVPVKFRLNKAKEIDPKQSFVYRKDLAIQIINEDNEIVKTIVYGWGFHNYHILRVKRCFFRPGKCHHHPGHCYFRIIKYYFAMFKTPRIPDNYRVRVVMQSDGFVLGEINFSTR